MLRILIVFAATFIANTASAQDFSCRDHASTLAEGGLTRCLYPFGILVAGNANFTDAYIAQAARVVAQYIDPNQDGKPDLPDVYRTLVASNAWLPLPWDQEDWLEVEEDINEVVGFGMIAPRWWMDGRIQEAGPTPTQNTLFFEEVTHLYTEFGLGRAYPHLFGTETYGQSIVSRETDAASCDYWQHPENNCPGRPAIDPNGDCSDASCNATEFLFAIVANLSGNDLGDVYPGLAKKQDALRNALSEDFLELIENPDYGLPMQAFDYTYPLDLALK